MKRPGAIILLLCTLLLFASGCSWMRLIFHDMDQDQVSAEFKLAPGATLILVDDPNNTLADASLRTALAQSVEANLAENKVKITFVPQQKLVDLQVHEGAEFSKLAINRIGVKTGADQVIYINIESLSLNSQPGLVTPQAEVRVKVVDVKTGQRLYPVVHIDKEPDTTDAVERGQSVSVTLGYRVIDTDQRSAVAAVYRNLVDQTGTEVAELFLKHTRRERPATEAEPPIS